jgi:hypothetical protein
MPAPTRNFPELFDLVSYKYSAYSVIRALPFSFAILFDGRKISYGIFTGSLFLF